ncbi:hypothetical protein FC84_GL001578 [Lapidilactobacillus dextrinicus DSM 20335]|uniref:Uncharacterized protein n=1 Tax=Lapidilactobacillus dextrinicus DSM 20335 TaxID=1423738 RepID=A0A0R2BT53_9LACO|nr:hypothetical protein [Lapidilactobacillus dextrinicus]KRM79403.1 hypothetical protein FC84_GL001578 [Lapidilactobacillus dextrinicus DSM 20335]QFG46766.1 hypothetical protein LH506_04580 [Lapidilactobacillus dextrinicus]
MDYKNTVAKQITNSISGISRQISVNDMLDLEEGQIITLENAESWTNEGSFSIETVRAVDYVFTAINEVPVHEVDYNNAKEVEELSAEEVEREVLVPAGTKFEITDVGIDLDLEELGYIPVEVKYIAD